jgi:hypothetical protein
VRTPTLSLPRLSTYLLCFLNVAVVLKLLWWWCLIADVAECGAVTRQHRPALLLFHALVRLLLLLLLLVATALQRVLRDVLIVDLIL